MKPINPNDWKTSNGYRHSWGTKNYKPDMDFTRCMQSEISDKHRTVEEIYNAVLYYDNQLEQTNFINSIDMLLLIQQGLPNSTFDILCNARNMPKKLESHKGSRKIGSPQEIANRVHNSLDWLRATEKRTWDDRPLNSCREILDSCIEGLYLSQSTFLHYDEMEH